jgi:hypothetical protein
MDKVQNKPNSSSEDGLLKKPKHVKAYANNKCNLITLGGVNGVVLIVLTKNSIPQFFIVSIILSSPCSSYCQASTIKFQQPSSYCLVAY